MGNCHKKGRVATRPVINVEVQRKWRIIARVSFLLLSSDARGGVSRSHDAENLWPGIVPGQHGIVDILNR